MTKKNDPNRIPDELIEGGLLNRGTRVFIGDDGLGFWITTSDNLAAATARFSASLAFERDSCLREVWQDLYPDRRRSTEPVSGAEIAKELTCDDPEQRSRSTCWRER